MTTACIPINGPYQSPFVFFLDTGVSETAEKLRDLLELTSRDCSISVTNDDSEIFQNLEGLIESCSSDNWDGYDGLMANNMYYWHEEMANYIKNTLGDKNHLVSTSFGERNTYAPSSFSAPSIDVTSGHMYGEGRDINADRYDFMNKMEKIQLTIG